VAEGVYGLLLALTRDIAGAARDQQARVWGGEPGPTLAGSTMAIIGLGTIGEAVARRAQGWDLDVIGVKGHPEEYDGVVGEVYGPDRLLDVCARADILVLTLPDTPDTRGLIGAAELEALGRGWLVNVGRGSVVDEAALVEALASGKLAGAGLDVFEQEPLPPESPLWAMPNVVVTPHNLGNSTDYAPRLAEIFAHNLSAYQGTAGWWVNRVVEGRRRDLWPVTGPTAGPDSP
jgi:phosphoglycerate dehydrogenase-like enzyme